MNEDGQRFLDSDDVAVVLREIHEVQHALENIAQVLKCGKPLQHELALNVLRISEFRLTDVARIIGIETDGTVEMEKRYAQLRAANVRIQALETQIGSVQAPELTQLSLRNLHRHLNAWWDLDGFGHISEIHFGPYGCAVKFSCALFGAAALADSSTPVSDMEREKLWHESLRQKGFILVNQGGETSLADCDTNRHALCELITTRLPSAKVTSMDNIHRNQCGFVLRSVDVHIQNITEILGLAVPEKSPLG
jgi:hypothetical protein